MRRLGLEKMVHGGAALARLENGRVALVRGGVPGETVEAALSERAGVLQGVVTRVLTPSPDRVPESEHPGLDYSHIAYGAQLRLKREVVADTLARSLKREVAVPDVVAAPKPWGYRHVVQPAVTEGGLGYRRPESHEVVLLKADPVAHEAIDRAWRLWLEAGGAKGVRELVFRCNDVGEVLLCLVASASPKNYLGLAHALVRQGLVGVGYAPFDPRGRFRGGFERLAGRRALLQRYGRFSISVTLASFAQPNPAAASSLYGELEAWAGEGERALDLYAGSGIIGLHLSDTFERVTALELDRGSVVRGGRDAARLGVANLEFLRADVRYLETLPEAELICVDPPRSGLAKAVRGAILASAATRLIYVSCDVATWARDVAHFLEAGFDLARLQPYDFYPQTHHVEVLSLLTR